MNCKEGNVKLHVIRFGCAVSSVWALAVFLAGLVNLISPNYGVAFMQLVDSIYPGYTFGQWGIGGVFVAALYAAVDAWIMGALIAWLYNLYGKFIKKGES
jgi:hypothetical protein